MSGSVGSARISCWSHDGSEVRLSLGSLLASVDQSQPEAGLAQLCWQGADFTGNLMGITAGEETTTREVFTRGSDLIISCASEAPQPFQWQVYWHATALGANSVQVDLIVSLQTELLKSFPSVFTYTRLQATEAWLVSLGDPPRRWDIAQAGAEPHSELHCIVLRDERTPWSYVEMTDPADEAESTLTSDSHPIVRLSRNIGGRFLEKGVIRRIQVRGVFVPREKDLEAATKLFATFCDEAPPLTA